jgi:hypothetical protein
MHTCIDRDKEPCIIQLMQTINLTVKEIETAIDRICLTVKETAKKRGVSPDAIKGRSDRIVHKTHSVNFREAIYKLTSAGIIAPAVTKNTDLPYTIKPGRANLNP